MKEKTDSLYQAMLMDIEKTRNSPLPEGEKAESCFRIAGKYWGLLQQQYRDHSFADEAEEIDFFRNIKPRFTGQIQYFIMLYEANMFVPNSKEQETKYWEEELKRCQRFCDKNNDFINYYKSGSAEFDADYFLRGNGDAYSAKARIYDNDPDFSSSHDHLVASFFAYNIYKEFIEKRRQLIVDSQK